MKTKLNIDKNIANFTIEVAQKDFVEILNTLVDEKIKTVEMDGFRKGKMPKAMFMKKYGYGSIMPDAIDKIINDGITELVVKNHLDIAGQFEIDWDKLEADPEAGGFKCSGKVEIVPTLELVGYKEAHKAVKKPEAKVTKKAIKEEIDRLLDTKAIMELKDGAAAENDTVVIDFVGSVDGEEFPGGTGENYPLVLGSNTFIPGFEDQLIGAKAEDMVEVKVTFPETYQEPTLAGKDAIFKTTVHEVKTKTIPKLTDELAKEIREYEVQSAKELEEAVEKRLLAQKEAEVQRKYADLVFDYIRKENKIKVPQGLIDRELDQQIAEIERNMQAQGMSMEMFLQFTGGSIEAIKKDLEPEAKKRALVSMVLKSVIVQEKLTATAADVNEFVKEVASAQNTTQKEIKEQIKELNIEQNIKDDIISKKAYELVMGE